MIPFDYLFFGLLAVVALLSIADLLLVIVWRRLRTRLHSERGVRDWIQVWPPDDQERDYTPVPDWFHKRKR